MKRILSLVLIIALMFVFSGCQRAERSKRKIFRFVEKNYDAIVEACVNEDADALSAIDGVTKVKVTGGYVIVFCQGAGIAPSSQDYGFYYSEDSIPVTVGCNLEIMCQTWELIPEGDGYYYISHDHNYFYTEHIKDNIYFYSNAY